MIERLAPAGDFLHAVRIELQRPDGRRSDRLTLEDQDRVAEALGLASREASRPPGGTRRAHGVLAHRGRMAESPLMAGRPSGARWFSRPAVGAGIGPA